MTDASAFFLHPYTRDHASAVVDMLNAASMHTTGYPCAIVDGVGEVRLARYVPSASDKVVAVNRNGEPVGFGYLANKERNIVYEMGGGVHPACWNQGIGTSLIHWAEGRARELSSLAPPGVRTVLQAYAFQDEARALRLFPRAGFSRAREWVHFSLKLDAPPRSYPLPIGITLREMDLDEDWEIVGSAMDEAFADHWGVIPENILPDNAVSLPEADEENGEPEDHPLAEDASYSNAPGFCFIAMAGDSVAGGILCNARLVERTDAGRVGSLFVRPQFRGRGIGKALMHRAFLAFWQHGFRSVILDTDSESFTDAPRFYRSLGMQSSRYEIVFEKEICPGVEIRRLIK